MSPWADVLYLHFEAIKKTLICFFYAVKPWQFGISRCVPILDKVWFSLYTVRIGQWSQQDYETWYPSSWSQLSDPIHWGDSRDDHHFHWQGFSIGNVLMGVFPCSQCGSLISPEQPGNCSCCGRCPTWQGHIWGMGRRGPTHWYPSRGSEIVPAHGKEGYVSSHLPLTDGKRRQRLPVLKIHSKGHGNNPFPVCSAMTGEISLNESALAVSTREDSSRIYQLLAHWPHICPV